MYGSDQRYLPPVLGGYRRKQRSTSACNQVTCILLTASYSLLYQAFRDYLYYLVHLSEDPFWIKLETAIPHKPRDHVATTHRRGRDLPTKDLDLRISTGAFYSRFVHYAHTSEAFDRECLFTDERNRTLWISQPGLLPGLLPSRTTLKDLQEQEQLMKRSSLDELRWTFLRKLRCPPADPAYPISPKSTEFEVDDIRDHTFSELDRFVRGPMGRSYAGSYRREVTKLFLAQRYALGFTEVIDLLDFCLRVSFCWLGAKMLVTYIQDQEQLNDPGGHGVYSISWWATAAALGLCHTYGMLKGYR